MTEQQSSPSSNSTVARIAEPDNNLRTKMESYRERLRAAFWVSVFVAGTLVFLVPTTIYTHNAGEFSLRYVEFLVFSGVMFTTSVVATSAALPLLRGSAFRIVLSLLFAVGVLCVAQGNLLVWNYGPLTGQDIPWGDYWVNGVIDSPIWIAGLAAAVIFSRRLIRNVVSVSIILIAFQGLQLLALVPYAAKEERAASVKRYVVDASEKFTFSASKNAILIVLDEMQSDIFEALIDDGSIARDSLPGFTYYPDAVGSSTFTEIAVPGLLTGVPYDNSLSRQEYLEKAYLESSVLARLLDRGFRVDAFPWVGWANESMLFDSRVASNFLLRESGGAAGLRLSEKQAKESINLVDLTLMRCAPHFLKSSIYNEHQWFLASIIPYFVPENVKTAVAQDNKFDVNRFVQEAETQLRVGDATPTFKYYHLKGAHEPLTVNQELEYTDEIFPLSRDNYVRQFTASIVWLGKFFDLLRQSELYEGATIVVVGDHGAGRIAELQLEPTPVDGSTSAIDPRFKSWDFRNMKSRANPMVLVKQPGASGALKVSRAPVSLFDVPNTILTALDASSADVPGRAMTEIDPADHRERHFYAFDFSPTARSYLPPISHHVIAGNVRRDDAWTLLEILSPPE